tara:strand:- start:526 stop:975 length:450 start_codon:yes stop_codon:yes gene_type:complete
LNFFLYINKNLIFIIGILITFFFLIIIVYKEINQKNIELTIVKDNLSNADIAEPKFAINNDSKKIFITAKEGNFLNKDEILLKDNVKFKSNDFSIETQKVVFDRSKQTAKSDTKSLFKSENTTISSDGFDIYDNGNKIIFYGSSFIILK